MKNQFRTLLGLKKHLDETLEKSLDNIHSDLKLDITINNKTSQLDMNADIFSLFQQFVEKSLQDEKEHLNSLYRKKVEKTLEVEK